MKYPVSPLSQNDVNGLCGRASKVKSEWSRGMVSAWFLSFDVGSHRVLVLGYTIS